MALSPLIGSVPDTDAVVRSCSAPAFTSTDFPVTLRDEPIPASTVTLITSSANEAPTPMVFPFPVFAGAVTVPAGTGSNVASIETSKSGI